VLILVGSAVVRELVKILKAGGRRSLLEDAEEMAKEPDFAYK